MRAVKYHWSTWLDHRFLSFTGRRKQVEERVMCMLTMLGKDVLSIRYDNGQLCTFRRREQPAKPSVPPETGA